MMVVRLLAPQRAVCLVTLIWLGCSLDTHPSRDARPPILLICSDTHRYDYSVDHVGPELMPRLQALREESVSYRRAWSNGSWTLPAIASVATGRTPPFHRTGLKMRNGQRRELDERGLPPGRFALPWQSLYFELTAYPGELVSLPERLAGAGYRTALVTASPFYVLSGLAEDGYDLVIERPNASATRLNAEVAQLLSEPHEVPLFINVHYLDVHDFGRRIAKRPRMTLYRVPPALVRRAYAEAVSEFDDALGELLDLWDRAAGFHRSLVVFYSDHGDHLFDPGHPSPNGPFPEPTEGLPLSYLRLTLPVLNHGNSMQESLLRIPLLVKYPDSLDVEPRAVDVPVSLVDLYPTILDVAGIEADPKATPGQGLSLLELGDEPPDAGRLIVADNQLYGAPLASARRGSFKLVYDRRDGSARLYKTCLDCRPDGDPGVESHDAGARRELLGELQRHLDAAEKATAGLRSHREIDPHEVEKLRALGYVR